MSLTSKADRGPFCLNFYILQTTCCQQDDEAERPAQKNHCEGNAPKSLNSRTLCFQSHTLRATVILALRIFLVPGHIDAHGERTERAPRSSRRHRHPVGATRVQAGRSSNLNAPRMRLSGGPPTPPSTHPLFHLLTASPTGFIKNDPMNMQS
ncbi:hypothetical protein BDZ97DRAFT_1805847, partial [Flammula alnicola]